VRTIIVYRGGGPADGEDEIDGTARVDAFIGHGVGTAKDHPTGLYKFDGIEKTESEHRRIYVFIGNKTHEEMMGIFSFWAENARFDENGLPLFRKADDPPAN